ncbi:MAG: hypothetical protein JSU03_14060 [Bacteroidetes bacterium]|nr:hypothetical protein [Bacteroidota bacterium]
MHDSYTNIHRTKLNKNNQLLINAQNLLSDSYLINFEMLSFILHQLSLNDTTIIDNILMLSSVSHNQRKIALNDYRSSVKDYYTHKKTNNVPDDSLLDVMNSSRIVKNEYQSQRSLTFSALYTLLLATVYSSIDYFHIPVFYDFRGRIYCGNKYLHYQAGELAKSLLLFHEGSVFDPVNEGDYFRYGVMLYTGGVDDSGLKMS